jgi:hypothetical protein
MISESENAWPLRSDPADSFGFLATAKWVSSCGHPICVETLPLSKVTGLAGGIMLLSKSGPTDICPHPLLVVRSYDRTPKPSKWGAAGSATPTRCSDLNAAADKVSCQVTLCETRAFSSEVDTGSREENASKQKDRAPFRFHRNGKGSALRFQHGSFSNAC